MNKFLRSAAFPILIVILLVFVAQRLVVSDSTAAPAPTFSQLLTDIEADAPFAATVDTDSLQEREGCPGQWLVPPGQGFLVQLEYEPNAGEHAVSELRVHSSDPDQAVFSMRLEGDRPAPGIGDPAPNFSLITSDGAEMRLAEHLGKVVFIKPLTFT